MIRLVMICLFGVFALVVILFMNTPETLKVATNPSQPLIPLEIERLEIAPPESQLNDALVDKTLQAESGELLEIASEKDGQQHDSLGRPVLWSLSFEEPEQLEAIKTQRDLLRQHEIPAFIRWGGATPRLNAGPWMKRSEAEAMQKLVSNIFSYKGQVTRYYLHHGQYE